MSILDWLLNKEADPQRGDELDFQDKEAVFYGLNMKNAIDVHLAWRHKLEVAIANRNVEGLDQRTVASDGHCDLGKWLNSEAKRFSALPEYKALCLAHTEFHAVAGDIVIQIQDGAYEAAAAKISTDLRRHSGRVQFNLIHFCNKANAYSGPRED